MRELADQARCEAELAPARGPLLRNAPRTMVASCASTTSIAPSAPSCRRRPTPRPRPPSMRSCATVPLRRRDALGPASLRRLLGDRRLGCPGPKGVLRRGQPLCRDRPRPLGRPGPRPRRGEPTWPASSSTLGLIDAQTLRRIACDATVVIALDDDVGHTMYEGRAKRFPSDPQRREVLRRDRQCRFPGCANATFTNVHHILGWKPGGRTDLDNLALLCVFHHRRGAPTRAGP